MWLTQLDTSPEARQSVCSLNTYRQKLHKFHIWVQENTDRKKLFWLRLTEVEVVNTAVKSYKYK